MVAQPRLRLQVILINSTTLRAVHQLIARMKAQRHVQRSGDGVRNVFLDGEDISELTVVVLGPDMRTAVQVSRG